MTIVQTPRRTVVPQMVGMTVAQPYHVHHAVSAAMPTPIKTQQAMSPQQMSLLPPPIAAPTVIQQQSVAKPPAPNGAVAVAQATAQHQMQQSRGPHVSNKSLGHYILGKTIGEGTFGKVKLGRHILTGEKVAVKVLEKDRIIEVADVERVAREVQLLKLIRHPHVVQLFEIIETKGQLYLIMEYACGGELFDYIVNTQRIPEPEACQFFHQIIAGVEKIHSMNVVHRDLKPENLLLDEHKKVKIVDFGLSNSFMDKQRLKTACGSPCYAPPEMVAGHSYVPQSCDLWCCGVILFAMVCGYLPFEDNNTSALYKKILAANYTPPAFISNSVKELIAGLLTVEPSHRFTIARVRAHEWYRQVSEASTRPRDLLPGQLGLDEDVLLSLKQHGFPREYAISCLQLNKHNNVTTTYYLLAAKRRRMMERLQFRKSDEENGHQRPAMSPSTSPAGEGDVAVAVVENSSQGFMATGQDATPLPGSRDHKILATPTTVGSPAAGVLPGASAMDPRSEPAVSFPSRLFTPPHTATTPRRETSTGDAAPSPSATTAGPLRGAQEAVDALSASLGASRPGVGVVRGAGGRAVAGPSGSLGQAFATSPAPAFTSSVGSNISGGSASMRAGAGSPIAAGGPVTAVTGTVPQVAAAPSTPRARGYPVASWAAGPCGSCGAREPAPPPPSPGGPSVCSGSAVTPQRSPEQRGAPHSAREPRAYGAGGILSALWSRGTGYATGSSGLPATSSTGSTSMPSGGNPELSPPPSARDLQPGTPKGPALVASNQGTPVRRPTPQQQPQNLQQPQSAAVMPQVTNVDRRPLGAAATPPSAMAAAAAFAGTATASAEAREASRSAEIRRRAAGYPDVVRQTQSQQSTPTATPTPQQQHQHQLQQQLQQQQQVPQSPRPEARYVIRQPLTLGSAPAPRNPSTTPLSARARMQPASHAAPQPATPRGSLSAREHSSRGAVPLAAPASVGSAVARSTPNPQQPAARMAYPTAWAFGGRIR
eukprot:CAMPEP_0115136876 /NCGR_PEP_ID=MMETSP0227-20121206/56642_1 /TAXON_ID=89957 /ORGANISM="Polarella glacialis, Strain CCMP 1383" /LENGTH=994 /DNA_ID=CAMNT_0002544009 /DNA_START=12 /DNA_END=2996 /DNA_ORIENTATION=+